MTPATALPVDEKMLGVEIYVFYFDLIGVAYLEAYDGRTEFIVRRVESC